MKVGEIIFHYSTGRKITEFYFSIEERKKYISIYKDCSHYTVIPYEGAKDEVPNYLDVKNKRYTTSYGGKGDNRLWKLRQEIIDQNKAA